MVEFTPFFIATGIIAIIGIGFGTFVGALIIYKYFKYKYRPLFWWGASWIFLMKLWWPAIINFILIVMGGEMLSNEMIAIIAYSFEGLILVFWMTAWAEIMYKKHIKLIVSLTLIYTIILEIYFWIIFSIDLTLFIDVRGPFEYKPIGIALFLGVVQLFVFIVTAFLLFNDGRKSTDPEIRVKGTLFLGTSILFFIGVFIYALVQNFITFIITRILLIISAVFYYISQVWPDWAKKIFIRKK